MAKQVGELSLRDLSRAALDEADQDDLIKELTADSDRSAALVASTVLDNDIARVLELILVHNNKSQLDELLYSPQAPLSQFSARIKIVHAIGLVDGSVFSALNAVRNVRNVFAHAQKPLKFTTRQIAAECQKLPATKVKWPAETEMSEPRNRYLSYCVSMALIFRYRVPELWVGRKSLWTSVVAS